MLKNKATFFIFFINYCQHLKKRLETHPQSTIFTSFINGFDIFNIKLANTKSLKTSYVLWRQHCWSLRIKDLILVIYSLYKYTQKVILYMVLTDKKCLEPNIQPKIANQDKSTNNMMRKIWAKKTYCRQKISEIKSSTLFFFGKKAKYMSVLIFYHINIKLLI